MSFRSEARNLDSNNFKALRFLTYVRNDIFSIVTQSLLPERAPLRQLALDIILNSAILNRTTQKGVVFSAHSHQGESFDECRCGFFAGSSFLTILSKRE